METQATDHNPYTGGGREKEFRLFDTLPPIRRQKENYCIHWYQETPEDIQMAALVDYGNDHPQAQGYFCWPLRP